MTVATDPRKTGVPSSSYVLAQVGAAASAVTGTVNETTIATVTVPGGAMGANGSLRITSVWSVTNNANAKTVRIKLGTGMLGLQAAAASVTGLQVVTIIRNRGSVSSQMAFAAGSNSGVGTVTTATPSTGTENTATDLALTFTGQLGVGTDSITLEGYTVEVLPG